MDAKNIENDYAREVYRVTTNAGYCSALQIEAASRVLDVKIHSHYPYVHDNPNFERECFKLYYNSLNCVHNQDSTTAMEEIHIMWTSAIPISEWDWRYGRTFNHFTPLIIENHDSDLQGGDGEPNDNMSQSNDQIDQTEVDPNEMKLPRSESLDSFEKDLQSSDG